MKKLILIFILLFPSLGFAEPFLTCDPNPGVTKYRVTVPAIGLEEFSNALLDGSAYHDIASIPDGVHDGELQAGKEEYSIDGVGHGIWRWSAPTPFTLGIPQEPGSSTGIGLSE
jgi:hypothetical protein